MSERFGRRGFLKIVGVAAASVGLFLTGGNVTAQESKATAKAAVDVKAYAFKCGTLKTQTQYMLKDTRIGTPYVIPITFFMIQHGKDWVAFDTGNNVMVAKDPVGYWGKAITDAYWPVMAESEEFRAQIKKDLGIESKDIKAVIISHGHLDHAGAIDNFKGTNVPIYFQKKELGLIKEAVASGKITGAYVPADFKVMDRLNIKTVDGIFDLFDDGTIVAFPTPGHTPGHQSLLVKPTGGNPLILAADAMYTLENMKDAIPPGLAWDIPQSLQALHMFKMMDYLNAAVIPSHDPDFWKSKAPAPKIFAP